MGGLTSSQPIARLRFLRLACLGFCFKRNCSLASFRGDRLGSTLLIHLTGMTIHDEDVSIPVSNPFVDELIDAPDSQINSQPAALPLF